MKQLSCFIACAFGRSDVDEVYDKAIAPTLVSIGIQPCRVDLIIHNDDIDNKIVELIKTCDICIADLTYARPSVYFESGFFSGLDKPVIYTSRKDHFSAKAEDEYGNFRIHFDLQMKPIIQWPVNTNKLQGFAKALHSRVLYVTQPLMKNLETVERQQQETHSFSLLSQDRKIEEIKAAINKYLLKNQWKKRTLEREAYWENYDYYINKEERQLLVPLITASATKKYFEFANPYRFRYWFGSDLDKRAVAHIYYISLRRIPTSRIEDFFHTGNPLRPGEIIDIRRPEPNMTGKLRQGIDVICHFISEIVSIADIIDRLEKHIAYPNGA